VTSTCTGEFWEQFNALPPRIRQAAKRTFELWLGDPRHGDFKKLKGHEDVYQVRPAEGCRALCQKEGDDCVWFWIGTKAEAKRLY
jgi:hypothetical protein